MSLYGSALNWSRTSTPNEGHKALNLARLPIPPPGRWNAKLVHSNKYQIIIPTFIPAAFPLRMIYIISFGLCTLHRLFNGGGSIVLAGAQGVVLKNLE